MLQQTAYIITTDT